MPDLTIAEFGNKKGIPPKTIWRWIKKGYKGKKLFASRHGLKYKINESTGEKYLRDMNS